MTAGSTEIETLVASWESAERELREGGYQHEADVVAVCREALARTIDRQGAARTRVLLRVWADDAAVLKTYGYQSAAESLWRCREALEAALESEPGERKPGAADGRPSGAPAEWRPVPPPGSLRTSPRSSGERRPGGEAELR